MLYLNFSLRSDAGRIRGNNEDNFYWNGQYRQDITCMKSALVGTAVPDQKVLAWFATAGAVKPAERSPL